MTTSTEAIENAARLLRNREKGLVRTYGSSGSDSIPLAVGWADLARAIAYVENYALPSPSTGRTDQ